MLKTQGCSELAQPVQNAAPQRKPALLNTLFPYRALTVTQDLEGKKKN